MPAIQLLLRTYDIVALQRVRSILEQRGIAVHVSDEFTFAVPGMPGAEQPRALWVGTEEWGAALHALRYSIPPDELEALGLERPREE